MTTDFVTETFRERASKLKPQCLDCGGHGPLLHTNDEWSGMTCLKCVEKKHKGIIKTTMKMFIVMFGLVSLIYPSGLPLFLLIFLFLGIVEVCLFWPYYSEHDGRLWRFWNK